jgi:hypothetical protein
VQRSIETMSGVLSEATDRAPVAPVAETAADANIVEFAKAYTRWLEARAKEP